MKLSLDKMMHGGVNVGDNGADGTYEANGANIAVTAGTYDMTLDTVNGTYTLTVN